MINILPYKPNFKEKRIKLMNISLRDRVYYFRHVLNFETFTKKYIICKFRVRKLHIYAT